MFDFINYGIDRLQVFLLVMVRASGLFLLAPVLSHRAIPLMVKTGLVILLSGLMVTAMPAVDIPPAASLAELLGMLFRELLAGVLMGFVLMLFFYAAQAAGSLVGYQMALAMAQAIDPATMSQESVIGRFWFLVATLIFLAVNGHHLVLQAFHQSFQAIPPGQVVVAGSTGELVLRYSAYVFVLTLKIAAPVMVAMFLTDVALGVVAKMMPTMNVFFASFGIKIGAGLLIIAIALPVFAYLLRQWASLLDGQMNTLLITLGEA